MEIGDWNPVMQIAKRLAHLDLVVSVWAYTILCPLKEHRKDDHANQVIVFDVARSSLPGEVRKNVYLDPETLNFLLPAGLVMEPDTFLNSNYTEIIDWLGLRQ